MPSFLSNVSHPTCLTFASFVLSQFTNTYDCYVLPAVHQPAVAPQPRLLPVGSAFLFLLECR